MLIIVRKVLPERKSQHGASKQDAQVQVPGNALQVIDGQASFPFVQAWGRIGRSHRLKIVE